MKDIRVIIENFNDEYFIYNEAGSTIDPEPFDSYDEAEQWARENGYKVVLSFNF